MEQEAIIADRIDGVPHPAENLILQGHDQIVSDVLKRYSSGRMHHALLLTGQRGIGKATFAFRLASHVFRHPEPSLAPAEIEDYAAPDVIDGKIAAGAHPNLLHLARPWDAKVKKFKTRLTIDEVRKTNIFFGTSRGESGWRVAIVDAVDDMNANAANALLKVLEEPPDNTLFLVLAHSPAKVLPTIRSRCQQVSMKPLETDVIIDVLQRCNALHGMSEADAKLVAELSNGSARMGLLLARENGLEIYKHFNSAVENLQNPDWVKVQALADSVTTRGKEDGYRLLMGFAGEYLEAQATGRSRATTNTSVLARWAEVWEKTQKSTIMADAYNLDKKQVILNLFHDMGEAARI